MSKRNTDFIRLWTEPATKQTNDDLYPFVALGDEAAREKMIRSNVGLVMWAVDRFLIFMPSLKYMRDDLIASGMVGLIEAVNKMAADGYVDNANATALMSLRIQSHVGKAAEAEPMIPVPLRTLKRKRDQGINLQIPRRVNSVDLEHGRDQQRLNDVSSSEQFESASVNDPGLTKALADDPRRMQEIRRMIDACCENDMEREIVRLREEGFVDREIAERLGLPLTTTYVMRRTLYARFLELSGWKGEV